MAQPETKILKECMLELSKLGARVWRNDTGGYKLENGGFVRAGLCKGSSDIIGIYKSRFLAVEVKTPKGKVSKEQEHFIKKIIEYGGIAFVCNDAKKIKSLLDDFEECI